VIRFSIYGHVHNEYHGVHRSFSSANPIGVNYWSGSTTTYGSNNPSFRVFEVDVETGLPVKVHTYVLDINAENPQWTHSHELTEYYAMEDLSPSSFDELSERFLNDEQLALKVLNTKTQYAPSKV